MFRSALLLAVGFTLPVAATPILMAFSGTVVSNIPQIPDGSPFTGELYFDGMETINSCLAATVGTRCSYDFSPADYLTLKIGSYTFSIAGTNGHMNELRVDYGVEISGVPQDRFIMSNENGPGIVTDLPGYTPLNLGLDLVGPWGMIESLSPNGLPTAFDLSKAFAPILASPTTGINLYLGFPYSAQGSLTSLQVTSVPEPNSAALMSFGVGLLILGSAKITKKKQSRLPG